ncbi:MAG TPA: 4-(cytidine 5'-diphospho)-2-C-methyl-D-erythritol kinase [Streptosporangiaceae bacterium]|nr:4-(cytidine 5'-diphospho)-2-C-methyl-D-erythritol kinase [Streptosporangiaceae bacterium]
MTAVTVRVPAKINLQLSVGPARPDGFHELVTVFHAVSLYDEVTVIAAERGRVTVVGEGADSVPSDDGNLAMRAAAALAKAAGLPPRRGPWVVSEGAPDGAGRPGVAIEIRKRIPVAAGLAGGSADAAAALVACNELWQAGLSQQELAEVAAGIGSDVAFALFGGTSVGQGRGERLTPALVTGQYHWVLAFSADELLTPDVYQACDRIRAARGITATPPRPSAELMAALRSGDPVEVGPLLSNELQPAAISLRPELRRTLAVGREYGALGAVVSGSGPTCAFLATDAQSAVDLVIALTGAGVCRSATRVVGPAQGAVVVGASEFSR